MSAPEITITPRQERREVRADISGAPDMPKRFTTLTIRPQFIRVTWSRGLDAAAGPDRWRVDHVELSGPRVLKGGALSEITADVSVSSYSERPEWLDDLLADMEPSNAGAREVSS